MQHALPGGLAHRPSLSGTAERTLTAHVLYNDVACSQSLNGHTSSSSDPTASQMLIAKSKHHVSISRAVGDRLGILPVGLKAGEIKAICAQPEGTSCYDSRTTDLELRDDSKRCSDCCYPLTNFILSACFAESRLKAVSCSCSPQALPARIINRCPP